MEGQRGTLRLSAMTFLETNDLDPIRGNETMRSIAYRLTNRVLVLSMILILLVTAASLFAKQAEGDAEPQTDDTRPLFDYDYDDSWVEKVPDVLAGFEIGYIKTPKSMACLNGTIVSVRSTQPTLDEFIANPPDAESLMTALRSIPGAPEGNLYLSFSPKPIDKLASAAWETDWNLKRIEHGCYEPSEMVRN